MKKKKTIGILGGMGPEASAYFYQLLIKLAHNKYGAVQDTDFPPIIIYNLPLEGFDETGIVNKNLVREQLIEGVQKLEKAGSDVIIIACNTVHFFYNDMQNAVQIPIFNIIEETSREVKKANLKKVGVLSSESTRELRIYDNMLNKFGIETLSVNHQQQIKLNEIIMHVMAGVHDQKDTEILLSIIQSLIDQGAEGIVLGCTELPLALSKSPVKELLFNSNEIITDKALEYTFSN